MTDEQRQRLIRLMQIDKRQRELRTELDRLQCERNDMVPELIGEVVGESAVFVFDSITYHLEGDIDDYGWIEIHPIADLGDWRDR